MSSAVQCKGLTKKGEKCTKYTKNESGYCNLHTSQAPQNNSQQSETSQNESPQNETPPNENIPKTEKPKRGRKPNTPKKVYPSTKEELEDFLFFENYFVRIPVQDRNEINSIYLTKSYGFSLSNPKVFFETILTYNPLEIYIVDFWIGNKSYGIYYMTVKTYNDISNRYNSTKFHNVDDMKEYLKSFGCEFLPEDESKKLCQSSYKYVVTGNYNIFENISRLGKDIYIIHYNYYIRKGLSHLDTYSYDVYYITKKDYDIFLKKEQESQRFTCKTNEELRQEFVKLGYEFKDLKDVDFMNAFIIGRSAREIHGNDDIFLSIQLFSNKTYYILDCYVKENKGLFYHVKFIHKSTYNLYAHRKKYSENYSQNHSRQKSNSNYSNPQPDHNFDKKSGEYIVPEKPQPNPEQKKKYLYLVSRLHPDKIKEFYPDLDGNIFKQINEQYQKGNFSYIEKEYEKYKC